MNIGPYTSYFHDGSIIDIQYNGAELLISMESAELPENLKIGITLSDDNAFKGILHLQSIRVIYLNEQPLNGILEMQADCASIIRFSIINNRVHFFIEWINYEPSKQLKNDEYTDIVIEADHIFWENKHDLYDPFR